ncbi:MAG: hypothetical protein AAFO69_05575, partial [Bacteroidota bacterium]
ALNDLNDLGTIVVNSLAYEIDGIEAGEVAGLDALEITTMAGNETIELVSLVGGNFENTGRQEIELTPAQLTALQNELLGAGNDLSVVVNIDFAEVPQENIDATVRVYFDITLKIRR